MSLSTLGIALHNRPERRIRGTDITLIGEDARQVLLREAAFNRKLSGLWIVGTYFRGKAEDCEAAAAGKPVPSLVGMKALGGLTNE